MEELLANPVVQGAIAPFLVALVLALALKSLRLGPDRGPVWLQAVTFSIYADVIAALACVLAWP